MLPDSPSWKARAAAKRGDTLNKIRPEWRLSPTDLAEAQKQRDITGPFIQQFLEADEVSIISRDSVAIVQDIKKGHLSAVQVTSAFCKTAAIAHQIVSVLSSAYLDLSILADTFEVAH
jgi:amidase